VFENVDPLKAQMTDLVWVNPVYYLKKVNVMTSLVSHKDKAIFTYALQKKIAALIHQPDSRGKWQILKIHLV
jgi:hypothetical protein